MHDTRVTVWHGLKPVVCVSHQHHKAHTTFSQWIGGSIPFPRPFEARSFSEKDERELSILHLVNVSFYLPSLLIYAFHP